jgi:hypothetical protein
MVFPAARPRKIAGELSSAAAADKPKMDAEGKASRLAVPTPPCD